MGAMKNFNCDIHEYSYVTLHIIYYVTVLTYFAVRWRISLPMAHIASDHDYTTLTEPRVPEYY